MTRTRGVARRRFGPGALALIVLLGITLHPGVSPTSAAYTDEAHARSVDLTAKVEIPFLTGLSPARSVDTGVGLGSDGNVYVWGRTNMSMAGSRGGGVFEPLTRIGGLPEGTMTSVSGQIYGFNALQSDGTVWGWGFNPDRDGTESQRPDSRAERLKIGSSWSGAGAPLTDIAVLATTEMAGAGIRSDGTVWAWGSSRYGGMNGTGASQVPGLPDPNANGAERFPVALFGGYQTFWLLLNNGEVWYWGTSSSGIDGDPSSTGAARLSGALAPWFQSRVAPGEPYVAQIQSGINMGHAILSSGRVLSWGSNSSRTGRPGTGSPTVPGLIPESSLSNIVSSRSGFTGTMFLDASGTLHGYGASDDYGNNPQTPTRIADRVTTYTAGQGFYLWRTDDGQFWGKGYNPAGAIGTPRNQALRPISLDMSVLG
ncbi:RCC1 domain-containing protein [Leucobacter sp. M11]|uniref:RCC1 domain-containing protein n=1 Tax=Leucobacter sp. M11 TaxID=2993565 RepID=UPI002D7EF0C5|nr:hypothetical protein [Leucobacter sp. M11]MEB4616642.1 hypothetical protein [Leucobacter sp. M11]